MRLVLEILKVALSSLRANALRSLLTCLGIIIGVGAVITMIALGEGAQAAVKEQIAAMGSNLLYVRPGAQRRWGVAKGEKPLTVEDADALAAQADHVVGVVPHMTRSFQVEYQERNAQSTVNGTNPAFPAVENFQIATGRFLSQRDLEGRRRVAVLGSQVLTNLHTTADALLGESIKLGGLRFEVIGVLAEKGQASWFNPDDQIFIPVTTAHLRLMGKDRLRSITVQVDGTENLPRASGEIERILRRQHRIRPGQESDFSIRDQTALRTTYESTTRTFTFLLASIAAVSLVVGGIGIMNIMLVSVTERTREIGLRKSLGATARVILLQFLTEALALCLLGGVVGVLSGIGVSRLMTQLAGWRMIVAPDSILLSFACAATIGLFFGLYPAYRAARLDPITALHHE